MKQKIYYYSDLLNDDFAGNNIKTILTPANFKYINNNIIYKFFEFIVYQVIVRPIVYIFIKIWFAQKFENKKVLKSHKKSGYFIYGNHTNTTGDAFIPNMLSKFKKNYIIVNPDATSIKGIKTLVMMLGALPLPSTIKGSKKFKEAISYLINKHKSITIYPEAHLWPYYTDIRPFKNVSFTYPYEEKVPCFALTNVYIKRKCKFIKRPKIITYIDGPFYADKTLSKKESIQKLRDEVYNAMKENINKHPKYEYIKYVYKEKKMETIK